MAAVTHALVTASTTNTTSYASGSFTPVAGDLLVVFVSCSGQTTGAGTLTSSLSFPYTFTAVTQTLKNASADRLYCYVANQPAKAVAQTVTFTPASSATGAAIEIVRVSGVVRMGVAAIKQAVVNANGAAGGTPSVPFATVLTGNPTLVFASNGASPAGLTPPTGWTETAAADTGYSTPTTGVEYAFRNSGYTGTTVSWGATSATAWGAIGVEIDTTVASALIETLTDDFSAGSRDAAKWTQIAAVAGSTTANGTTSQATGALVETSAATAADYIGYTSANNYDLTGSAAYVKVLPVTLIASAGNGFVLTWRAATDRLSLGDSNRYIAGVYGTGSPSLFFQHHIAGTATTIFSVAYNSAVHVWWRFRHDSGTNRVHCETSVDGSSWTSQFNEAPAFTITFLDAQLYAGTDAASSMATTWDNFNTPSDTTVALTGVTGTGAVGTVTPAPSKALTGTAATGAVGSVSVAASDISVALTGVASTTAVGSIAPATSRATTGVTATGALGALSNSASVALTGTNATGTLGSVTNVKTVALTGTTATGAIGSVTNVTTQALTGVAATGAVGFVTNANVVTVTGAIATSALGTVTASVTQSAALTGVAATGAVGSLATSSAVTLVGAVATGVLGSVASSKTAALTGAAATGAVGSVSNTTAKPVAGVVATTALGSVATAVTRALTGVAATGAVGSVTVQITLSGVTTTTALGSISPSSTRALTGVTVAGALGGVVPVVGVSATLTGVSATGNTGQVAPTRSIALTGTAATAAIGSVARIATVALTGVSAAGSVGALATDSNVALTGVQAATAVGDVALVDADVTVQLAGVSTTVHAGNVNAVLTGADITVALTPIIVVGAVGRLGHVLHGHPNPDVFVVAKLRETDFELEESGENVRAEDHIARLPSERTRENVSSRSTSTTVQ